MAQQRQSFNLLIGGRLGSHSFRGVAFVESGKTTSEDYGVLYEAWEGFLKDKSQLHTNIVSLWTPDVTPDRIPYGYDLCRDGGLFVLYNFGGDKETVDRSKSWLRRSQDVVSLTVYNVKLVSWTPPSPFESIKVPDWAIPDQVSSSKKQ